MKKILVTGANGYIGARLSRYLAEKGNRITALCYPFVPSDTAWCSLMEEIVVGDLRSDDIIAKIANSDFNAVIHLVSLDHNQSNGKVDIVASVNVMPTWRLLEVFASTSLEKFIYFSTVQVYGKVGNEVITEERNSCPINIYGLTHLLSEDICACFARKTNIHCINVRLSNSYGTPVFDDNNCWWLVINDLCKTAIEKKKIQLLSDGSPQRDFIHGNDVCKAIAILLDLQKSGQEMQTFHVASGTTLTILELAHIVKEVYQERFKETINVFLPDNSISPAATAFRDRKRYRWDISRMQTLGFEASVDLTTGIKDLFEYLERHRKVC